MRTTKSTGQYSKKYGKSILFSHWTVREKARGTGSEQIKGEGIMEERTYTVMSRTGSWNIAIGIVSMVVGITAGVLLIISGSKLLIGRSKIIF